MTAESMAKRVPGTSTLDLINTPGQTATAKEINFGGMNVARYICLDVTGVPEGSTPPNEVWAKVQDMGLDIPVTPPMGTGPLQARKGVLNSSSQTYRWDQNPAAMNSNNPGELLKVEGLQTNGSKTARIVVWYRNGNSPAESYYIETRKVSITHSSSSNVTDCGI